MAHHNELGKLGEKLAVKYLRSKGYRVLETNWRYGRAEIDIIAMDQQVLVFTEVKARTNDYYGKPEEFITEQKQELLVEAATEYMHQIQHDWEVRFDVIGLIIKTPEIYTLDHLKDAFFPDW